MVFLADEFVELGDETDATSGSRFLKIAASLPLDLQMVLCNRMYGSPKDIVLASDSEPGFRWLAKKVTWL